MKVGIECEGRLCGVQTVFCSLVELNNLDEDNIIKVILDNNAHQLYISDLDNQLDLQSFKLLRLSKHAIITVEISNLVKTAPSYVNIILNIDVNIQNLRKDDQVKFANGLHIRTTSIRNMTETFPNEFDGDKTI